MLWKYEIYVIVSTAVCDVITLRMFFVYQGFKPYQFYDNTGNVTQLYKANVEIENMLCATALPFLTQIVCVE
jgi:hypothetical protein